MSELSEVRISTDYSVKGIDAAILENKYLRIVILTGKGGDIIEFRDKRADVDPLWRTHHNWSPPSRRYVPTTTNSTWIDHYPGGWQVNLPLAGQGGSVSGVEYGLHGESALIPLNSKIVNNDHTRVSLQLESELIRYPFAVEREMTLEANKPALFINESVTNVGAVELEYIWQHHIALGPPLIGPAARFDVPARTGIVEDYGRDEYENARLQSDSTFEWPQAPSDNGESIDLREFPPKDAEVNDMVYLTGLDAGWYAVSNVELDFGFGLAFPESVFESVWYWQPLGGEVESPFFGRNYNVGIEPTTAYPGTSIPTAQRENGTMKTLAPGETTNVELTAVTYHGVESVSEITKDGTVRTRGNQ